jgi:hypothetical protein
MKLHTVSAMVTESMFSLPYQSYFHLPHSKLHTKALLRCRSPKVNLVCRDGAKDG